MKATCHCRECGWCGPVDAAPFVAPTERCPQCGHELVLLNATLDFIKGYIDKTYALDERMVALDGVVIPLEVRVRELCEQVEALEAEVARLKIEALEQAERGTG